MGVILGIDPGSRLCGYGLIRTGRGKLDYVASGIIRVDKLSFPERLHAIYADISGIIEEYQPQSAAIEEVFMGKNAASALKLGQARGAAVVACTEHRLAVAEYSARKVKQALVGSGRADKRQMQQMVAAVLSLSGIPRPDTADALAVAVCHANSQETLTKMPGIAAGRRGRLSGPEVPQREKRQNEVGGD